MSKDYITVRIPTMDKNKAVHTLDMCVNIFNHWYGGKLEYELELKSRDCVAQVHPAEEKLFHIQNILASGRLRTTGQVIKQISNIVGINERGSRQ